jgi:septal ring factor EnvC (AmiA/AmiB activator)
MNEPTYADAFHEKARAFQLDVIKAELAAVREERDEYAECFEELKNLAYDAQYKLADARDELAAARDELRARDEAIADSDQRARWRLAQTPYIGIGEGIAERLAEALSPNLTGGNS